MEIQPNANSKVIILLATYNGQHYLAEQLDSICAQTHNNWEIWVSDDGSNDKTLSILAEYQSRLGATVLRIFNGPRKGFSANFLSLICNKALAGTYFAYADQDDFWHPTKLERAVKWLDTTSKDNPALYCGRSTLVDRSRNIIGYSPLFEKKPGFLNALVQNIGGGNTMVFNQSALNLLQEAGEAINIVAHDWWTYLVVTAANGAVYYDPVSTIDYRQHGNNQIGGNVGLRAQLYRFVQMLQGRFKQWNTININALLTIKHRFTEHNSQVLMQFIEAKEQRLLARLVKCKQLGLYRQTCTGNMGLIAAVFLKKI